MLYTGNDLSEQVKQMFNSGSTIIFILLNGYEYGAWNRGAREVDSVTLF